jgi:membrane protease YdiL (CAAX protease family)
MTLTLTKNEGRWGWFFLAAQFLLIPTLVAAVCPTLGIRTEADLNLCCFFLEACLGAFLFRELLRHSLRSCAGRWGRILLTALEGFGLYFLVSTAVLWLILLLRPDFSNINDAGVNALIDQRPLLMSLGVVFAAPLAEECLFRGWIFTGLARKSIPLAYCVTALTFSAAHIVGYIGIYDLKTLGLCFLQYLGPSLVLCRTCRKADSLMAPLLLHIFINTIALFTTR